MTARRFANLLGASAVGVITYVLNPHPVATFVMFGNAAVAIWWGIHILVTKRPW